MFTCQKVTYIYLECRIMKDKNTVTPKFVNNFPTFLFDEIRYQLNNFEIDQSKYPGITSIMKGYISLSPHELTHLKIAGWNMGSDQNAREGYQNFCIPLKMIFGYAEDYKNILINSQHELILTRSRTDHKCSLAITRISVL